MRDQGPTLLTAAVLWFIAALWGLAMKAAMQDAPIFAAIVALVAVAGIVIVAVVMDLRPRALLAAYGLFPASLALRRGVIGAIAAVVLGVVLAWMSWQLATHVTTPLFPPPAGLVDDRGDGYGPTNPLGGVLGQFLENGLSEELVFRTPVTLWAVLIAPTIPHRGVRWTSSLTVLIGTSLVFAASHSEYGMWNMSSAAVSGLLFGASALTTRSLWPAVIGHTLYNSTVLVF